MKIDKLAGIFSALTEKPLTNSVSRQSQLQSQELVKANPEAVKISAYSGNPERLSGSERRERVLELKEQVSNGTYKPDSTAVAEAVARELFF